MIIFTGTGRSGTGWLAKCFDGYHEFCLREFILEKWPGLERTWHDHDERMEAMLWHLRMVRLDCFIDSSNMYAHFLDVLYEIDPEIKIVVCVRERVDFIKSAVRRGWHTRTGFHCAPIPGDQSFTRWAHMSPEERCGWQYDFLLGIIRYRLSLVPDANKLWCNLEDISKDLGGVEDFLGRHASDDWRHRKYNEGKHAHE